MVHILCRSRNIFIFDILHNALDVVEPAFLGRSPTMAGLAAKRLAREKMVRKQVDHQRKRQKKDQVTQRFGKPERLVVFFCLFRCGSQIRSLYSHSCPAFAWHVFKKVSRSDGRNYRDRDWRCTDNTSPHAHFSYHTCKCVHVAQGLGYTETCVFVLCAK